MRLELSTITQPTLLIDEEKCCANIQRMADKAQRHGVQLAPHFKTHQSALVGQWVRAAGIQAATVTSLKMATYFAQHGWSDITIAFPLNVRELPEIIALARQIRLTVFINSIATAQRVAEVASDVQLHFYAEIDAGYHRSGVPYEDTELLTRLLATTQPGAGLRFVGFYTHAGNTYDATSADEVVRIHQEVLNRLRNLKGRFEEKYPDTQLSLGDTPACSIAEDFGGVSVIRPGNFVYYDLTQHSVGANAIEDMAICLACPVVSVHPERSEVIVHGGWVHLGKDSLPDERGEPYYGRVVELHSNGWSSPVAEAKVKKVSQEHGVVSLLPEIMNEVQIGDLLGVLPIHACATADAMRYLMTLTGKKIEMMSKCE